MMMKTMKMMKNNFQAAWTTQKRRRVGFLTHRNDRNQFQAAWKYVKTTPVYLCYDNANID